MDWLDGIGAIGGILIIIGALILSILPIVLFFKVWRMTNDVKYMSQMMITMQSRQKQQNELLQKLVENSTDKDYIPPYESQNGWGDKA